MSEAVTIVLSKERMEYLTKYAGSLGQKRNAVAGELLSLLLDDMKADDGKQNVSVPIIGRIG